jgi:hypothetical protein
VLIESEHSIAFDESEDSEIELEVILDLLLIVDKRCERDR